MQLMAQMIRSATTIAHLADARFHHELETPVSEVGNGHLKGGPRSREGTRIADESLPRGSDALQGRVVEKKAFLLTKLRKEDAHHSPGFQP
jgi:hypothetical protein